MKLYWSKIKYRGVKPLGWWYHKVICEIGYNIEQNLNSAWGLKVYYKHLNKMCDKYKITLYGQKLSDFPDTF